MKSAVAFSKLSSSEEAGTAIGREIRKSLGDRSPDALIVFASSRHDYAKLLQAIQASCAPKQMVGCSSAGEFIGGSRGEGSVSALALLGPEMNFRAAIGRGIGVDRTEAARQLVGSFEGIKDRSFEHRSALLLADALAGHTDELIESLTAQTAGGYRFFGGGAGDDAKFSKTHVFFGTEVVTDAAVALEILSHNPIGVGVRHGWEPVGSLMRVTEADGMKLISINSIPAADVIAEHARSTGQRFDPADPVPFFLHNTLGIVTKNGNKLRVPLAILPGGAVLCASNVPSGATISFMKASSATSIEAARDAVHAAVGQLEGRKPKAALFFDCVATRLRMGSEFGVEVESVEDSLGEGTLIAGCNTYGQIARVEGQFSGFHNCTAVVCVFGE